MINQLSELNPQRAFAEVGSSVYAVIHTGLYARTKASISAVVPFRIPPSKEEDHFTLLTSKLWSASHPDIIIVLFVELLDVLIESVLNSY